MPRSLTKISSAELALRRQARARRKFPARDQADGRGLALQGRINAFPDPVQARKDFIARPPMGRLGTVDDIAPILVYLASDESKFATGGVWIVDGGIMI